MKKTKKTVSTLWKFIAIMLFFTNSLFASPKSGVQALSTLTENEIDIGVVALVLAKEVFPEIDIQNYSAKIDTIVSDVKTLTRGSTDPDYQVRALNTHLYRVFGMQYDMNDPYVKKIQNRYINGILDTKKGSCVSMPLLYFAVAQRLRYPVYPVSVPQHIILRYVDPRMKMQNIEATGGGGYSPNEEYIASLQISFAALVQGTYLRTLTYREYLGLLIEQNGIYWGKRNNNDRSIEYLEIAVKLNPRAADSIRSLGIAYRIQSKKVKGRLAQEYTEKATNCFAKAKQLGVTNLVLNDYVESQRKAQQKFRNQNKSGVQK
jgi:regulator of sirC expression with transglutaminase-like and TPR domain